MSPMPPLGPVDDNTTVVNATPIEYEHTKDQASPIINGYTTLRGYSLDVAIAMLDQELEPNAYSAVPGASGLTDISPAYMYETIDCIFGPVGIGWTYEVETLRAPWTEKRVSSSGREYTLYHVHAEITIRYAYVDDGEIVWSAPITQWGGSSNETSEWAEKGAVTNAIGAAWSVLGWQLSVYKGLRTHTTVRGQATPASSGPEPDDSVIYQTLPDDPGRLGDYVLPEGSYKYKGKTLAYIAERMEKGLGYLKWAAYNDESPLSEETKYKVKSYIQMFGKKKQQVGEPELPREITDKVSELETVGKNLGVDISENVANAKLKGFLTVDWLDRQIAAAKKEIADRAALTFDEAITFEEPK